MKGRDAEIIRSYIDISCIDSIKMVEFVFI